MHLASYLFDDCLLDPIGVPAYVSQDMRKVFVASVTAENVHAEHRAVVYKRRTGVTLMKDGGNNLSDVLRDSD